MQINQLRYDHRAGNTIEFSDSLGTVATGCDYEIGILRMPCLEAGLKCHAGSRESGFKTYNVAQNAFDTRNVRWRISLAGDSVAIGIDTNCRARTRITPPQRFVKQNPSGREVG